MTSTSYDEVPYDSQARDSTHPDCLAALATLLGMTPAAVDRARVLELGAGTGGNLLPMAQVLPQGRFVGIDLSTRQIALGQETVRALGLDNIQLIARDLMAEGAELGEFDYIICHGVYSWVPPPVQERILAICKRCLAPQGVAYVSYNTYPGWHLRGIIREAVRYHARRFDNPADRLPQARALVDFLVEETPLPDGAYARILRDERERWQEAKDYYLYHEQLEDDNSPCYFHEFAGRADANGLQYLGEAAENAHGSDLTPRARETLAAMSDDLIQREQYLDFLRNRTFRRTLLCHQGVPLERTFRPERLEGLWLAALARPTPRGPDEPPDVDRFVTAEGVTVSTNAPLMKVLLHALFDAWPRAVTLAGLAEDVAARFGVAAAQARPPLAEAAAECYLAGLVRLHTFVPPFAPEPPERPRVTPLARLQARQGGAVTNLRHISVEPPDWERRVLLLLDGTRDRAALVDELAAAVARGEFVIRADEPDAEPPSRALLAAGVEQALRNLARYVLLLPG